MLVFLYFIGLLAIAGAVVAGFRHARTDPRRRSLDTLPLVCGAGAAGLTALTVAAQLTIQPDGELRYVLTAGVVCGGVVTAIFAAWLNYRRYRVEEARQQVERDKADLEQRRHVLEREKVELEHAKDRREHAKAVDESLLRAVELLGHAEARVRAGALHTLAGLTVARADRVQEVVELVCMYLRNAAAGDPAQAEAQRALLHVVEQANRAARPVDDLHIDLTGARLDGFRFERVAVASLNLRAAHLTGGTALRGLRLAGGKETHQVNLDGAEFAGTVALHGARLRGFSAVGTVFREGLSLEGTVVEQEVALSDCVASGDVDFGGATFGRLTCRGSRFEGKANLRRTMLRGGGTFLHAWFGRADFEGFASEHPVVLDGAHFAEALRFLPALLPSVSLRRTTVSAAVAANGGCQLPPGWRLDGGYLVGAG